MNQDKNTNFWSWILIAILIVLLLFIGFWLLNRYWYEVPSTAAEFGDSFGMANTIFSALAFSFLIVTAVMQKKELELQREELSETRKELKKSADAQNASQKALNTQVRVMSKQALLTSYQSLLDTYTTISGNQFASKSDKTKSKSQIRIYLKLIENMAKELEEEFSNMRNGE